MTKMNPEVKAEWLKRLRSGDYLQIDGALRGQADDQGSVGYCCLGVLCEIAVEQGVATRNGGIYAAGDTFSSDLLPRDLLAWAGLLQQNPEIDMTGTKLGNEMEDDVADEDPIDYRPVVEISELNDTHNYGFTMLADLIEAQL